MSEPSIYPEGGGESASAPINLARVVGAIRAHAPELSDDLDDAISAWLEERRELPTPPGRRARLRAFLELLHLSPYDPDPRD